MTLKVVGLCLLASALARPVLATNCGNGVVDSGEQCDLGGANGDPTSCCTTLCEFRAVGLVCRPSAGDCDVAETCTGASATCPGDMFQPSNFQCRPSAGPCDLPETCSGSGPTCPDDAFRMAGTVCRAPAGTCDVTENCDGSGPDCPPDGFVAGGTVCRQATGDCDLTEVCSGTDPNCPPDALKDAGTVCRPGNGVCDPAEVCDGQTVACPQDAFAPDGTACNDGSACTDQDACFRGACVGTANVDACIDDFLLYKISLVTPFTPVTGVHLVDFDDANFDLLRARRLGTPTDDGGQGTVDPATHLMAYTIRTSAGSPRHTPRTNIKVSNNLGIDLHVDTILPDLLLVPTAKNLTSSPPAPDPQSHNLDHYKCYRVRITPGTPRFPERVTQSASDQFISPAKTIKLKKPRHFCTPVDLNGSGIKNPGAYLMCYLGKGSPKTPRHNSVFVHDEFGPLQLNTVRESELCIPSTVTF